MPLPDKCPRYTGFRQDMTELYNSIFASPDSDPLKGVSPEKYENAKDPWIASNEPYVWTNGMKNSLKSNFEVLLGESDDKEKALAWRELTSGIQRVKQRIEGIDGGRKDDPDLSTSSRRREYRLYQLTKNIEFSLGNMGEKEKLAVEFDKMAGKMSKYGEQKEKYIETLTFSADVNYLEDGSAENLEKKIEANNELIDSLNAEYKKYSVDEIEKAARSLENACQTFSNDELEKEKAELISRKEQHENERKEREEALSKSKQYIDKLKANRESIKKDLETEKQQLDAFSKSYNELKADEEFFGDLAANTGYDSRTDTFSDVSFKDKHYEDCRELLENLVAKKKLDSLRNTLIEKLNSNPVYVSGESERVIKEKKASFEKEIETGKKNDSITDDERKLLSDYSEAKKAFASAVYGRYDENGIETMSGLFTAVNVFSADASMRISDILESKKTDNSVIGGEKFTNGDHIVEIAKRFDTSKGIAERYEKAKKDIGFDVSEGITEKEFALLKKENIARKEAYLSENAVKDLNREDYYAKDDLDEKIASEEARLADIDARIKSNNDYIGEKKKALDDLNKNRNENIKKRSAATEEKSALESRRTALERAHTSFVMVKGAYGDMLSDSLYINDKKSYADYKAKVENGVKKSIVDSASELYDRRTVKAKKSNSKEFNDMISSLDGIRTLGDEKGSVNASSDEICGKLTKLKEDAEKYIAAKKKQFFVLGTARRKFRLGYAESIVKYTDDMIKQYKGVEKAEENLDKKREKFCDAEDSTFWAISNSKESVFENHIKPVAAYANIINDMRSAKEKTDFVKGNVVSVPKFDYQKAIEVQQNHQKAKENEKLSGAVQNEAAAVENK